MKTVRDISKLIFLRLMENHNIITPDMQLHIENVLNEEYSDQQTVDLKLISEKQAELIKLQKDINNFEEDHYGQGWTLLYKMAEKAKQLESEISALKDQAEQPKEDKYCQCYNEGWTKRDGITICRNCLKPVKESIQPQQTAGLRERISDAFCENNSDADNGQMSVITEDSYSDLIDEIMEITSDNALQFNQPAKELLDEREVLIKAFDSIRASFQGRSWILEGRGAYPYDDERYKEEVRYIMDEFEEINKSLWRQIKSKSFEYRNSIEAPLLNRIKELESIQQPALVTDEEIEKG